MEYGVREWELHKPSLNLAVFCATELEVSVVPPPHLFSFLFYLNKKNKKTSATNISNNKIFIQLSNDRRITWWSSNMIGMKILKDKDVPNYFGGSGLERLI